MNFSSIYPSRICPVSKIPQKYFCRDYFINRPGKQLLHSTLICLKICSFSRSHCFHLFLNSATSELQVQFVRHKYFHSNQGWSNQCCPQAMAHGDFSSYSCQMRPLLFWDLIYSAVTGIVNVVIFAAYYSRCAVYFEMCRQRWSNVLHLYLGNVQFSLIRKWPR